MPLGLRGEKFAARYLKRLGYKIVSTGCRNRFGEIDLVAVDGKTVVFVEVKTRRFDRTGHPADAVDERKRSHITRTALAFLKGHGLLECPSRFDVIAIRWPRETSRPKLEHYQNAFEAVDLGQTF